MSVGGPGASWLVGAGGAGVGGVMGAGGAGVGEIVQAVLPKEAPGLVP